ncbi:MAG: CDP-diacylglycerol--glycerol-3-phosphate 3-phosphatidyltransferase [Treponema sp.]|jgi:CDP-diacylglycerol--glycerol-3-phosphate 3-phosphatidyltransferase|nr:CDP-diacylglycerol--glycerol-3-phosphate 3-phosphatidyltransferase [Treponema sp.]
MTLADKVTTIRVALSPVFFTLYLASEFFPSIPGLQAPWTVIALWLLFIISEITDLMDGRIARNRNEVSDFGKLYDPFADVLVRVTYFLCFVITGILPVILLLIVLYREFGILFLRVLMMKKGLAMGARKGGKLKALTYMLTGIVALLAVSVKRMELGDILFTVFRNGATAVFIVSTIISVLSFVDYIAVYRRTARKS